VVQVVVDLTRLGQIVEANFGALRQLFFDDLVAEVDALVADVDARSCNELLDLLLALPAERALQQVAAITELRHRNAPSPLGSRLVSRVNSCLRPTVPRP